ncbi:polygalacturonase [Cryptomeria japonica]|uniref:polygalacturonase n=1 Tax=Cryptomeria japonica TaxID=3369 RepID=UPI0027DA9C82|nr:polygalacturonase [Cryptomeria japonica]
MGNIPTLFHSLSFCTMILIIMFYMPAEASVFNVETYGAVGNGVEDSTKAFANAWAAACKAPSATLLVPGSKTFLVNGLVFQGPCAPGFTFLVEGTIVAPPDPANWNNRLTWFYFQKLQQFTLSGNGTINGQGQAWWLQCRTKNIHHAYCTDTNRPTAIQFNDCSGLEISGLSIVNSPLFHMTFDDCMDVKMLSLKIIAPGDSPNTDGIDIFTSKNFIINDTSIGTGDDCIAIGEGSSNITITSVTCGPGHGISIGSLGKGNSQADVSDVKVLGAKLIETQNGLRIKTWQGGSGMTKAISFEDIQIVNAGNPIVINQYYCDLPYSCPNQTSAVKISNVSYNNIHGTSASEIALKLDCSESVPCTGITLSDISLTLASGGKASSFCQNAEGVAIGTVNPPSCLST